MRDITLGIFLSVADVSKNRKQEVNLFVLSLWMKHVHNEVDNVWWRTKLPVVRDVWWRTQLPGVTRNRYNTVFANVIETSNVKCTAKAIRWTQHKEESNVVFQYVDCHSANNVLKIDVFQLIICTVILKVFTY